MGRAVPLLLHLPSRKGPSFSWLWGPLAAAGGGSPSSAWRWYKSQRTFSLAQSAGVCSGSHWGRGGGPETPETQRDPSLSWEWMASCRGDPAWTWKRGRSHRALVPRLAARLLAHAAGAPLLRHACVSSGLWLPRATPTSRPLPLAQLAPHLAAKPASWRRAPSLGSAW